MWTPHFQFDIISMEGGKPVEQILTVLDDGESREFCVQFFLDDIRLRRKEIQFQALGEPNSITFTDSLGRTLKAIPRNNSNGRIESIICILTDTHPIQAIWYCFRRLSYLLSYWSLVNGGSQCIYGIRVLDTKHEISFKSFPDEGVEIMEPVPVFIPPSLEFSPSHKKMLSIYREARNSTSPYYGFLCSFKIMEGVEKGAFSKTVKTLKSLGINEKRKRIVITEGMLELARAHRRYPQFAGLTYQEFMKEVNDVRVKIAHALTNEGEMYDFDDVDEFVDTSMLASLADLLAREILVEEFRLQSLIAKTESGVDDPAKPYVDNDKFLFFRLTLEEGYEPNEKYLDFKK